MISQEFKTQQEIEYILPFALDQNKDSTETLEHLRNLASRSGPELKAYYTAVAAMVMIIANDQDRLEAKKLAQKASSIDSECLLAWIVEKIVEANMDSESAAYITRERFKDESL